jgi:acyl-CoA synthetase
MFTSGTTGLPKLVRVPHRCVLPNIRHIIDLFRVLPLFRSLSLSVAAILMRTLLFFFSQPTSEDRWFLSSPHTFDPSIIGARSVPSSCAQAFSRFPS